MLKKIFIMFITITLLVGICGSVNATENSVKIEKTVTNYVQFSSSKGGEVVLEVRNVALKENASYQYQLKYNELETEWYDISDIDLENNTLNITLEKAKADILAILKITDIAYITIQETDEESNVQTLLESQEVDISLPLSKAFKVGHFTGGHHGIEKTYGVEEVLYKYVKVDDVESLSAYIEYYKGYASYEEDIYWGYYVDNLIDEMDLCDSIPTDGWETLTGDTTTVIPTEKGLYFIWIKAPATAEHKELVGCVFSNKGANLTDLEEQLEEVQPKEELTATVSYDPTTTTTTGKVTATIKTNKKVNEVEGWTLSEDGMTLTKEYSTNATETVHLVDIDNMTKDVVVKITNIIKEEPKQPEEPPKDDTTATGKLPQAGVSATIITSLIAVTIISIIIYKKYNSYKDIK